MSAQPKPESHSVESLKLVDNDQARIDAINFYGTLFRYKVHEHIPFTASKYKGYKSFADILISDDEPAYYGTCIVKDEFITVEKLSKKDNRVIGTYQKLPRTDNVCFAQVAIVLDDIGTRVNPSYIKAVPTFIVATSPKNYQYVYVLTVPCTDKDLMNSVLYSIKVHRPILSDPGALGSWNRLARLPYGINGKKGGGIGKDGKPIPLLPPEYTQFRCHLVKEGADPNRTYEPLVLLTELGVGLVTKSEAGPGEGAERGEDSVLAWLITEGYTDGVTTNGYVKIECPWVDEHTNRDKHGTGYSPLGHGPNVNERHFNCFHSHNYSTRDYLEHISLLGAPVVSYKGYDNYQYSSSGILKKYVSNVVSYIKSQNITVKYDEFNDTMLINGDKVLDEGRIIQTIVDIERMDNGNSIHATMVRQAYACIGFDNTFNPVVDYFNGLVWDGVPRAESIFIEWLKCEDNALNRAITRLWLLAVVKRTFEPGCVFDHGLFLVGNEGTGKSSILRELSIRPQWHVELTSTKLKDIAENTKGKLVFEFVEGVIFSRHSKEEFNSAISGSQINVRLSYRRDSENYLMRGVFCGGNNNPQFMQDDAGRGVRRVWSMEVGRKANDVYDYVSFKTMVPQIWAEVVSWYKPGVSLDIPESLHDEMILIGKSVVIENDWLSYIVDYLDNDKINVNGEFVKYEHRTTCIKAICEKALHIDFVNVRQSQKDKIIGAMKILVDSGKWSKVGTTVNVKGYNGTHKGWKRSV
jgi:hypothetical protein